MRYDGIGRPKTILWLKFFVALVNVGFIFFKQPRLLQQHGWAYIFIPFQKDGSKEIICMWMGVVLVIIIHIVPWPQIPPINNHTFCFG